jgi:hypothetical protein
MIRLRPKLTTVVFREVSSHENADALGSLAAVSKDRDCATMNHPPSTAFQFHLMPAANRYLYVSPGDQPNVYGSLRTTQHGAGIHDGDATRTRTLLLVLGYFRRWCSA